MIELDSVQILRINSAGQQGVALLDDEELSRPMVLSNAHLLATRNSNSSRGADQALPLGAPTSVRGLD